MHVHQAPAVGQAVQWPVWVGDLPQLAAAFQPRAEMRDRADEARRAGCGVVLSGPGGVGKSQLAASLARRMRDEELAEGTGLEVLVWARATSPDQVISAYAQAAEQLLLPGADPEDEAGAARLLLRWLTATQRRWLVVLDDVTDPTVVAQWWPDSGSGKGWVLATTRREDAQLSGQGRNLIRLGLYTPNESLAYLRRRLTDAGQAHLYHPDGAAEMADELGYLPLALGHAAAYLINTRRTTADYLTLLRDNGSRLDDLLPLSADTEGYGRPVTASLLLSLNAIDEADTTHLARPLLHLASLMDPLGHPATAWTTPAALEHLRTVRLHKRRWLRRHHPVVTEAEVHSTLEYLRTYALITRDTATAPIRIHALTARAVRETISQGNLSATARAAADTIISVWPDHDHENQELAALLRANTVHLDRLTRPALWQPTTHPCIYRVSQSLTEAGLYQQAVPYDEITVRYSTALHGPDHPDSLTARHNLASSYSDAGRIQEALDLRERVLADRERVLGEDHQDTLDARHNLAISFTDAGRIREALDQSERVLADRERVLGKDHQDTLDARNNLAVSYTDAGRIQEALDLNERVLADYERVLGQDHPDTLTARNNLASSYTDAGRIQEALDLSERVLADYERVLGQDHPETLNARNNLAVSYSDAGRVQEALDLSKLVLADRERVLGEDHPATLITRHNLAVSYTEVGRIQEALDLRKRVLADYERVLGQDHPETLNARNNLAVSYRDAGSVQEALDLRERVLADYERVLGQDHPATLNARHNLAVSYSDAGRIQEALDLRERVLADRERVLGEDHPDTLNARNNLANSYSDDGRTQEALDLRERALADYERVLGQDHPATLNARHNLAVSYSDAGRIQEALDLNERVLADRERVLGEDHPATLITRHNLAVSYAEVGRSKEALDLRKRVLADYERVLGKDHPDTLHARHNLANDHQAAEAVQQPNAATSPNLQPQPNAPE
ncbi:tetratricopeptide repeat protein [Streptomyces sp. NPDC057540]|uniref:tetratricopeptide repeat protein n=1 Tax=Streptomyces sp. NPDC057540 TaxID=3346160 RepID=UPI0036C58A40